MFDELTKVSSNEMSSNKSKELSSIFPKNLACSIIYLVCLKENFSITKIKLSKCLNICYPTLCKSIKIIEDNVFKNH